MLAAAVVVVHAVVDDENDCEQNGCYHRDDAADTAESRVAVKLSNDGEDGGHDRDHEEKKFEQEDVGSIVASHVCMV